MQVKRLIRKRIRRTGRGLDLVADVNADVSVNVAERRVARPSSSTAADRPKPSSHGDAGPDDQARGRENP